MTTMFKFTRNYVLGALVVLSYTSFASAAPSELEGRNSDASDTELEMCINPNYGLCTTLTFIPGECYDFTGTTLGSYDKAVSSAKIPTNSNCKFTSTFGCLSGFSVTLGPGDYPDFGNLPDNFLLMMQPNFNDTASSVSCVLV